MNVDIQSLFWYNPKTKEFLVRVGNLLFPFKSSDEVYAYLLKLKRKGCGMMGQERRGRRYFPLRVGVKNFSPNPYSMPIPQNPFQRR